MRTTEEVVRGMYETAREAVVEGGECVPVLIVRAADPGKAQDLVIVLDEFPPEVGPTAVRTLTERAMADPNVAEVVFMTEGWVLSLDREEAERFEGQVSEHPDRQEVVLLTVTSRAGVALYRWPIRRPEGAAPSVEWLPAQEYDSLEGRMIAEPQGVRLH